MGPSGGVVEVTLEALFHFDGKSSTHERFGGGT